MSKSNEDLIRHALGLDVPQARWSTRNYAVTAKGTPEHNKWRNLQFKGHADLVLPGSYRDRFMVTQEGMEHYGLTKYVRAEDIV